MIDLQELRKKLCALVETYAYFDRNEKIYKDKNPLTTSEKQRIEADLIGLFSYYLSQDGPQEKAIKVRRNQLYKIFHSDKGENRTADIEWINSHLGQDSCFKLVRQCLSKTKPGYLEFSSVDVLIKCLEEELNKTKTLTLTKQALLTGMIAMLKEAQAFGHSTNTRMNPNWMRKLIIMMPCISSVFCLNFCVNELALAYALVFALSRGGDLLKKSDLNFCKLVGQKMQDFSYAISEAVTAFVARLITLNIYVVRNIFNITIDSGAYIYGLLTNSPSDSPPVLRPEDLPGGNTFSSLELKLIAFPLEYRVHRLELQWLGSFRLGSQKKEILQKAIRDLLKLDKQELSMEEKLQLAKKIITQLVKNKVVNASSTHKSIEEAKETLKSLARPSLMPASGEETALVCYDPP